MQVKTLLFSFLWMSILINQSFANNKILAASKSKNSSLHFIRNIGQVTNQHQNVRVDIDARLNAGQNLNVFIGNGQLHYQWSSYSTSNKEEKSAAKMYRMDVQLIGVNPNAIATFEEQQPYFERYYLPTVTGNHKA